MTTRVRRGSFVSGVIFCGLWLLEGAADAQSTSVQVCQRWTSDRADLSEGTSTANIATCSAGDLMAPGRPNSLKLVNLYRFLAGMPPVTEDPTFDSNAQACALMQAANGLSHTPSTTSICYTAAGLAASSRSSLCGGQSVGCIDLYMTDDPGTDFGHRRWIFSNALGPVGFGSVGMGGSMTGSCFYQVGGSGNAAIPYVAWPPPGAVPLAAITTTGADTAGWSIQSDTINLNSATATVTDMTTNQSVTVTAGLPTGFGSKYAMKILPSGWKSQAGHNYTVTLGGTNTPITYTIDVIDCSTVDGGTAMPPHDAGTIDSGANGDATIGGGSSSGSASGSGNSGSGANSSSGDASNGGQGSGGITEAGGSGSSSSGAGVSTSGGDSGWNSPKQGPSGCSCSVLGGPSARVPPGWGLAWIAATALLLRRRRA